jgi:hypothetical protein
MIRATGGVVYLDGKRLGDVISIDATVEVEPVDVEIPESLKRHVEPVRVRPVTPVSDPEAYMASVRAAALERRLRERPAGDWIDFTDTRSGSMTVKATPEWQRAVYEYLTGRPPSLARRARWALRRWLWV